MKRFAAMFVVCLMLGIMLTGIRVASAAAGSQRWYIDDVDPGQIEGYLTKTRPTDPVQLRVLPGVGLVINETIPASITVDMSGNWTTYIRFQVSYGTPNSPITMNVSIGNYSKNGGITYSFYSKGSAEHTFSSYGYPEATFNIPIETTDHIIHAGDYLAIKVNWNGGGVSANVFLGSSVGAVPYIESPPTDPGYPVPELSTLILMSSGLVAGIGMLAYSSRKKKAK